MRVGQIYHILPNQAFGLYYHKIPGGKILNLLIL